MQYLQTKYLEKYNRRQHYTLGKHFKRLAETKKYAGLPLSPFLTAAAVYSSLIEGSQMDEDTFFQYKEAGITGNQDFNRINDLIDAYSFAVLHQPDTGNFLKAHEILSRNLVESKYQGKFRDKEASVYQQLEKIYEACPAKRVAGEMEKLFADMEALTHRNLSIDEVFYYAALLHLSMAQIHPFADGNGRAARLLEKWFLAQMLGRDAWLLPSEKMYWKRRSEYYQVIHMGSSYDALDLTGCVRFLVLLPQAFRVKIDPAA